MKRFLERLQGKLYAPVAYFAVHENGPSGFGYSAIRHHWHFLVASESHEGMSTIAQDIWSERFGNAKIDPYDPEGQAAYYVSKLAAMTMAMSNLATWVRYPTTALWIPDPMAAAKDNDHVPERLKDKTFGDFLVMRPAYRT